MAVGCLSVTDEHCFVHFRNLRLCSMQSRGRGRPRHTSRADCTARESVWESRSLPALIKTDHGNMVGLYYLANGNKDRISRSRAPSRRAAAEVCVIAPLYADMVWPALMVEQRLLSVIPISAGLLVECLALRFGGFGLSWKRAAIVDVVMNTVSSVVGIVLIPALGFAWEFFPGIMLYKVFKVGTFNPGTWAATFLMAVFATTAIEASVVRWGFNIPVCRRRFWVLCAANTVSVGIAFASLWIHPPQM